MHGRERMGIIVYKWGKGDQYLLAKDRKFSLNSFKGNGYRNRIKKTREICVSGKFLMHRDIKYRLTGMIIKSIDTRYYVGIHVSTNGE